MKAALDTSVVASAFRSRSGASYRLLQLALDRRFVWVASPALFLEYEDVLSRPEQMGVHGFSHLELGEFFDGLAEVIEGTAVYFRWRPQLVDPNDELVFEAAMNGRVDYLVTHNVRDFAPVTSRFHMRVIRPSELLKELER